MTEASILVDNVIRSFEGTAVIDQLSFAVEPGSIYGFLGRNGSGKTTTMRMLAGLIKPDSGQVRLLGGDPFTMDSAERQWVGYMSEKAALPSYATVGSLLQLGRDLYPHWDGLLAGTLLSKYSLSPKKRFVALSQGSQRLLGFIMAIAPRPKVLLLDEPAANLDAVARREILDDILELVRDCGCTVLLSTHVLSDVERVADRIGILAKGRLCVSEPLDTLKDSIRQVRCFSFEHGLPTDDIPESLRVVRGKGEITVTLRIDAQTTPEKMAERWGCQQESRMLNLEDIFVELSRS